MTTPEDRVDEQPAVGDDQPTDLPTDERTDEPSGAPTDADPQPGSDPEAVEALLDSLEHEPVDAHPRILAAVDESLTGQLSALDALDALD